MYLKLDTSEDETYKRIMSKCRSTISKNEDFLKYNEIANINITTINLNTLDVEEWLNDDIINTYCYIITHPAKICPLRSVYISLWLLLTIIFQVYVYSTYFYGILLRDCEEASKHLKAIDIFKMDFLILPIHVCGNHWAMISIDMTTHKLTIYDSMISAQHTSFLRNASMVSLSLKNFNISR